MPSAASAAMVVGHDVQQARSTALLRHTAPRCEHLQLATGTQRTRGANGAGAHLQTASTASISELLGRLQCARDGWAQGRSVGGLRARWEVVVVVLMAGRLAGRRRAQVLLTAGVGRKRGLWVNPTGGAHRNLTSSQLRVPPGEGHRSGCDAPHPPRPRPARTARRKFVGVCSVPLRGYNGV